MRGNYSWFQDTEVPDGGYKITDLQAKDEDECHDIKYTMTNVQAYGRASNHEWITDNTIKSENKYRNNPYSDHWWTVRCLLN